MKIEPSTILKDFYKVIVQRDLFLVPLSGMPDT